MTRQHVLTALCALLTVFAAACGSDSGADDSADPTTPAPAAPTASVAAPDTAASAEASGQAQPRTAARPAQPVPGPAGASPATRWVPAPGTTWQWQLTTPVDTTVNVQVYDIDGTENGADVVARLHAAGRKVICYVNTGASEDFRPDHGMFPASVLGKDDGWAGEKWLDIRQRAVLEPIMAARFDACRQKGFDAVEADLVDGYTNDTGFPLTAGDQLAYNRMLAGLAHQRGMSIGLKNDLDQVDELVGDFDFAVNEQCAQYDECGQLVPFIRAGKAVFHVEYELDNAQFCPQTTAMRFSSMRKNLKLDAPRWPC